MVNTIRTNIRASHSLIRERKPFTAGGNTYGSANFRGNFPDGMGVGRLSKANREAFYRDMLSMTFVVYSYGTPIAWECDNGWTVIEQKFSPSTSRHQSAVRQALSGVDNVYTI